MQIAIVANPQKAEAPVALRRVCEVLRARGIRTRLEVATAALLGEDGVENFWEGADLVISLGGDGTLLATLHRMGGCEAPVAGVNIGTLGFLTTCTVEEIEEFARVAVEGSYETTERSVLKVRMVADASGEQEFLALNEVVLMRGETGRLISLEARIDGELLNHYRADGLLVATPTGSTAYNLAAGGPLVAPRARVFVIAPICPHSLSHRALVVGDDSVVEIGHGAENVEPILFTVDGRDVLRLAPGSVVRVTRAAKSLRLVRMPGHSFYGTLRKKLRWHGG